MIYDWLLVAAFVLAIVMGLIRLNSTFTVALLFCITFTISIAASKVDNWNVATIVSIAIAAGLILTAIYYLAKRFSPWRKATAVPTA
jgi:cell division protein FtsW (lipid II flippase)